ncbi:hypothetical protein I546_1057 [Mycobacterium kansasii 732]|nr:hypothetical protein I546_1057 [Mycobacterium kansasii 732]
MLSGLEHPRTSKVTSGDCGQHRFEPGKKRRAQAATPYRA